jgi:C4-dicarboxylate-specific signal transduction histidine kinase
VSGLRLPSLTHNLSIAYTGLSFVSPETVHFRYKLEGQDTDWREVVNERLVQYTNLAPGAYRFRVTASNNSGVWNKEGASLPFSIAPAYWQTSWFFILCVAAFVGSLASLYQWRIQQVAQATARKHEAEVELAHANRLATMGQLTASIAHEVNQPLAGVITNGQVALRWLKDSGPDLEEVRKTLGRIVRDASRAADIVKRIRIMATKAPQENEDVAINEAISEVILMTGNEATKRGISIQEDFMSNPPIVRCDRVEIQQVILNLLMNAMEALGMGGHEPREVVIRTCLNASGELQVSVSDSGPGIAPDLLERIFQPFYTSKNTGLGMGLSICRTIIEAHDGRLWADANTPRGAVFSFTLHTI